MLTRIKSHMGTLASAALFINLSAVTTHARPCPVANSSQNGWVRHESREFGIEMLAPPSFRKVNWSSRSDSTPHCFRSGRMLPREWSLLARQTGERSMSVAPKGQPAC